MSNTLPPPPPPTVYANVLPFVPHKGRVTPETWQDALLDLQQTREARIAMREVWEWERGNRTVAPAPKAKVAPCAPKNCDWCKREFIPRNHRQLRCSEECSKSSEANIRNSRKNPPVTRRCASPKCEVEFTTTDVRKIYCKESCAKVAKYHKELQRKRGGEE
jgi:uncharacterized Zn ribbon protein